MDLLDFNNQGTVIFWLLVGLAFVYRRHLWRFAAPAVSFATQTWGSLVARRPRVAANSAPPIVRRASTDHSVDQEGVDLTIFNRPTAAALATVPDAGLAIENTPNDLDAVRYAVAYMRQDCREAFPKSPELTFGVPFGWYKLEGETPDQDRVALAWSRLGHGFDNILEVGMKKSGKDNLAQWQTLCLMAQHSPEELQLVIVDGKGVDWGGFANKAHTLRHFNGAANLERAKAFLTLERQRRESLLARYNAQGIRKWQNIPTSERPPFLWIVITELTLVIQELGKDDAMRWLNSELSSWRALGGFICVVTQTVSKMDTNWRGQVDLFMSGAQPADDADEPNTMLKTAHIKRLGAVPPSELPPVSITGGIFCLTSPSQRSALNVRSSFIDDQPLVQLLATFPDKATTPAAPPVPAPRSSIFAVELEALTEEVSAVTGTEPAVDRLVLDLTRTERPLQWFRDQGGARLSDDDLVEYFVRRLKDEPEASPRRIALELWANYGGDGPNSSLTRVTRIMPRVKDEIASASASGVR